MVLCTDNETTLHFSSRPASFAFSKASHTDGLERDPRYFKSVFPMAYQNA